MGAGHYPEVLITTVHMVVVSACHRKLEMSVSKASTDMLEADSEFLLLSMHLGCLQNCPSDMCSLQTLPGATGPCVAVLYRNSTPTADRSMLKLLKTI
jgi:hypothetical protein